MWNKEAYNRLKVQWQNAAGRSVGQHQKEFLLDPRRCTGAALGRIIGAFGRMNHNYAKMTKKLLLEKMLEFEIKFVDAVPFLPSVYYDSSAGRVGRLDHELCTVAVLDVPIFFQHLPRSMRKRQLAERLLDVLLDRTINGLPCQTDIEDLFAQICGNVLANEEICKKVVEVNGYWLSVVPSNLRTAEVCVRAMVNYRNAVDFIPRQNPDLLDEVLREFVRRTNDVTGSCAARFRAQ